MLKNIDARTTAAAEVTNHPKDQFRYKDGPECFTVVPPGDGVIAMPIYWVFTPEEAAAEREAGELHREPLGEAVVRGQVYQVFSNETPARPAV